MSVFKNIASSKLLHSPSREIANINDNLKGVVKNVQTSLSGFAIPPTIYPLEIQAVTTNPTKGSTITYDRAVYWANGNIMSLAYNYKHTAAGAAGSGFYLFPLPDGFVVDDDFLIPPDPSSALSQAPVVGKVQAEDDANRAWQGVVVVYDIRRLTFRLYNDVSNASSFSAGAGFSMAGANWSVSFMAHFPFKRQGA